MSTSTPKYSITSQKEQDPERDRALLNAARSLMQGRLSRNPQYCRHLRVLLKMREILLSRLKHNAPERPIRVNLVSGGPVRLGLGLFDQSGQPFHIVQRLRLF